ncbi:MAG TPA: DUF1501 domain-containing protein [Pirellulales bacterium]|jgi:hypothetical protein|nr:DUF1501 domain-containing protein [Pirellulales bacterium]
MQSDFLHLASRRTFLNRATTGLASAVLANFLRPDLATASNAPASSGVVDPLHFAPKAKRVIFLCMAGGPTHLETLDYKPKLAELHGQPMPESYTKGQPIAQLQGQKLNCFAPQFGFKKFGSSGQGICEIFPHIGSVADELCIVRSMRTEAINHDPAHTFMNTGTTISGRPSMGSWLLYGLGSESDNLPGFVVLTSVGTGGQAQPIAARQWHSGFLPSRFQGVEFRSKGDAVLYVGNPKGVSRERQLEIVESANQLNRLHEQEVDDPEIATRIAQYEMAFKMQASVPELIDVSDEPQSILDLYGTPGGDGSFAANCLLARRLAERGVRFIQLYHRGWDHHGGIKNGMPITAKEVDQASAALIRDLKNRGMLDDTLVLWGGEFGRTPMGQGDGRDHHIKGFSLWLAGGGIKPGISYGATDELGYNAVENLVHVHDLHATMLYLLGIDHERLIYRYQGRDFRLTDVSGKVVRDILA